MPHVINGIGTWYYGSDRIHRLKSSCEFCHRIGELRSYDTTLYFVFVMVPVIPLKKMRILDECPHCKRHRAASLKIWEKAKNEAVLAALAPLAEKPNDREALSDALGVVAHYQDESLFNRIADFAKSETDDAKLQHQLGVCCGYFSRREEAETAFANALRVDDSPEIRKSAALNALRMGRPDRAEALLDFVVRDKIAEDAGFLSLVAESYMSHGQHEEALALMDKRDDAFPDAATVPDLVKLRKQASKYLGTGKRLNTVNLTDSGQSGSSAGNPLGARIAKFVFPIILLGLFIAYLSYAFWKGANQTVYLVNGIDRPYRVSVNGKEINLPNDRATPVQVPEGDVTVEVLDAAVNLEPVAASVRTGFFGRPFSSPVFLINPDRSAVVVEEKTTYSAVQQGVDPPPTFHLGEGFYQLAEPDYVFESFPHQLSMKKNQTITKTRVGLESGLLPIQKLSLAMMPNRNGGPPAETIKRLCLAAPNEVLYLAQVTSAMKPDEAIAFLKPGLAKKPLLLEWHRTYQAITESSQPAYDLVSEYRKLAEQEKTGDAKYLLARIIPEGAESDKMLEEAAVTKPDSPYSWYSLAYRSLARGDFPAANIWAKKAIEAQPNHPGFIRVHHDALWANRDYEAYGLAATKNPLGIASMSSVEQYRAAVARGDKERQKVLIADIQRLSSGPSNPRLPPNWNAGIQAIVEGDIAAYLASTNDADVTIDPETTASAPRFERAFLQAKWGDAESALTSSPSQGDDAVIEHGLLALAFGKTGNKSKAEDQYKAVSLTLKNQGRTEKRLAAMLDGTAKYDPDFVLSCILQTSPKRIVLALFAEKFPDRAASLRELAAKLDYHRDLYSMCLKKLREEK